MRDSLFIKGHKYTVDHLDNLPVHLLPENVFTPTKGSITAFYSKESPLSNHFPTNFVFKEKTSTTSKQCFMEQKALFFKDKDTAMAIMATSDPMRVEQFGEKCK